MHERLDRIGDRQQAVALRRDLAQAGTDDDQQIGVLQGFAEFAVDTDRGVTDIIGMAIVDIILEAERGRDRQIELLGPGLQPRLYVGAPAGTTDDHDGALGLGQQLFQRRHVGWRWRRASDAGRQRGGEIDLPAQHILGQAEDDRTGPAGRRRMKGPADVFWHPPDVADHR